MKINKKFFNFITFACLIYGLNILANSDEDEKKSKTEATVSKIDLKRGFKRSINVLQVQNSKRGWQQGHDEYGVARIMKSFELTSTIAENFKIGELDKDKGFSGTALIFYQEQLLKEDAENSFINVYILYIDDKGNIKVSNPASKIIKDMNLVLITKGKISDEIDVISSDDLDIKKNLKILVKDKNKNVFEFYASNI